MTRENQQHVGIRKAVWIMKKTFAILLAVCFLLSPLGASSAYAKHGYGAHGSMCKYCPLKQHASGYRGHGEKEYNCPVTGKFMKKTHFFLENQKELALTEEQVRSIKELKLGVKKSYIRQMAELQVFALDVDQALSEPKVDVEGIQAMIDQFSTSMSDSAKKTVADYAKLKSVLTPEQLAKAKELWLGSKTGS